MILPRGSIFEGSTADLRIYFSTDNEFSIPFSVASVSIMQGEVEVLNIPGSEVDSPDQKGSRVLVNTSDLPGSGSFTDRWNIVFTEGADVQAVDQSFYVAPSAVFTASDTYSMIILMLRIILGDNNPERYWRNPDQNGVNALASTPNLSGEVPSYKWSDQELLAFLMISNSFINNTFGRTTSFVIENHPNIYVLLRGAEILALKSSGTVHLQEHFDLTDGGASLNKSKHQDFYSNALQMETEWQESVKMWKYKFRPNALGVTSTMKGMQGNVFGVLSAWWITYRGYSVGT